MSTTFFASRNCWSTRDSRSTSHPVLAPARIRAGNAAWPCSANLSVICYGGCTFRFRYAIENQNWTIGNRHVETVLEIVHARVRDLRPQRPYLQEGNTRQPTIRDPRIDSRQSTILTNPFSPVAM